MLQPDPAPPTSASNQGIFPPTRWSLIHRMQDGDEAARRESMETICAAYWKPVYAWLRAQGAAPADAEDTTQNFFARLIGGDWLAEVHEQKGRLRSFLLVLLKRHAVNEHEHRSAKKRGGDRVFVPLDAQKAETAWAGHSAVGASPDVIFDRQWALQLLERVMRGLQADYEKSGKATLFAELRDYITGGSEEESYSASSERLGMTLSAVKVAAFRLRERYRQRLREVVLETIESADGLNEEIDYLFRVFRTG